jgi:hypothetical protein
MRLNSYFRILTMETPEPNDLNSKFYQAFNENFRKIEANIT